MKTLEKAQALMQQQPYTLDTVRQLETLEEQARGQEKALIGELWEALYAGADMELLQQLHDRG
ncbi:hypothetical protein [Ferrimonas sp.]|uniref:hypothetical protein n=1 Tax=Ferrimonas sp. TaxID=2080861 RepID=UPI003A92FE62